MSRELPAGSARVLEARFHPGAGTDDDFVVVARVVWRGRDEPPTVEPAPALAGPGSTAAMLVKLHYLVASTGPEPYARLLTLRSRFWSFVALDSAAARSGAS
jgi:hypothetical protein